jgi:hypothetical protein
MKRYVLTFCFMLIMFSLCSGNGYCLDVDFRGQVSSLYIMHDTNGFQHGVLDHLSGAQWRNTLQFDLTLKPKYEGSRPSAYLEKVFLSYRGSYDAIFATMERYDNIVEKERADFELGRDDVEWENDLRECFTDLVVEGGAQKVNLRLGRQIVRWGETDSFNVINVVNPSDRSYQMAFSNPDDLAIPLWMGRLDYSIAGLGFFDSLGIQLLCTPDIRPTQFAPLNGKDGFATFDAPYGYLLSAFNGYGITAFHEDVASSQFDNMEYGISTTFAIGSLNGALHYFCGHQHDPAIDWAQYLTWAGSLGLAGAPEITFRHPRQNTYGYSWNYFMQWANAVVRGEGALTDNAYLMDMDITSPFDLDGISKRKVYQNMVGFDKDLHPTWIGTTSALGLGVEGYWRHVDDWYTDAALHGFDKEDTYILTCLMYTDYWNYKIRPMILAMYDSEGDWMTNASIKYDPDGKWLFTLAQSSFWGPTNGISNFSYGGALISTSEVSFKVTYRF